MNRRATLCVALSVAAALGVSGCATSTEKAIPDNQSITSPAPKAKAVHSTDEPLPFDASAPFPKLPTVLRVNLAPYESTDGSATGPTISLFPGQEVFFTIKSQVPTHLAPAIAARTTPLGGAPATQDATDLHFTFVRAKTLLSAGEKIALAPSLSYTIDAPASEPAVGLSTPIASPLPRLVQYTLQDGDRRYLLPIKLETDAGGPRAADRTMMWAKLPWGWVDPLPNPQALAAHLQGKTFSASAVHVLDASGAPWRLFEWNGQSYAITLDYMPSRLDLTVKDDIISEISFG